MKELRFDVIGYWSEIKLDIVKDYAHAYSTILSAKKQARFKHVYIDAFAGSGFNVRRSDGEFVLGSPLNALSVRPRFKEFHLIDLDGTKVEMLRGAVRGEEGVYVYHGDCNKILLGDVFPRVRYQDFRRGLCLLDPYGLHLNWEVVRTAGQMRSIEVFVNFPLMDMNRKVFWHDARGVSDSDLGRMGRFWGDKSWRGVVYVKAPSLFGPVEEKAPARAIVDAYRKRLVQVAGFSYVPEPLPMRNRSGAIVYYLFFAAHKPVAEKIVNDIFDKYRARGGG